MTTKQAARKYAALARKLEAIQLEMQDLREACPAWAGSTIVAWEKTMAGAQKTGELARRMARFETPEAEESFWRAQARAEAAADFKAKYG